MINPKYFSVSNIIFVLLMGLVIITWINPAVKVAMIRGLMAVGAFKPDPADYALHPEITAGVPDYSYRDTLGNVVQLSTLKNKVIFILVDTDNDMIKSKAFFKKKEYTMPIYTSVCQFPDSLLNGTIPTTLIFGKDGSLKYKHTGAADYDSDAFVEFLKNLQK